MSGRHDNNGDAGGQPRGDEGPSDGRALRRGWTTGTCAAAASRAAFEALVSGDCPDPVETVLPNGSRPAFSIARCEIEPDVVRVGIVKDAGDDPDVTHGALIVACVRRGTLGSGVTFRAGEGVGTVTKPGLPISPGEAAINPVPREMIEQNLAEVVQKFGEKGDVVVEISIPGGEEIAKKTMNARLGILGGLSILGTTGIVIPYSCSAWIHSIYQGIDVARATGITHIAGATGSTSEKAIQAHYELADDALIDMGDFVGGMLKHLKRHPVARVTIAGGFAKITKLGQGLLDLHSKRGEVDFDWLSEQLARAGADTDIVEFARTANTAQLVLQEAAARGIGLGDVVANAAWQSAARALAGADIALDVVVFDREGALVGRTAVQNVHSGLPR